MLDIMWLDLQSFPDGFFKQQCSSKLFSHCEKSCTVLLFLDFTLVSKSASNYCIIYFCVKLVVQRMHLVSAHATNIVTLPSDSGLEQ